MTIRNFSELAATFAVSTRPVLGRDFPVVAVEIDGEPVAEIVLALGQAEVWTPADGCLTIGETLVEALDLLARDWALGKGR